MRRLVTLAAVALLLSCSHEPPKLTPEEVVASGKAAVEKAAQEAAAKAATEKAAADKLAAEAAAALQTAVAALPAAPALPPSPAYLGEVEAPADNAVTPEKAHLGWTLFFDPRLSKDGAQSCQTCHHIEQSYTSGNPLDTKVGGKVNVRNSPTVVNLGYHKNGYYWDGRKATLEAVSEAAWTGQLGADADAISAKLNGVPTYRALFQRAYGGPASKTTVAQALASFLRALKSGNSAWDKFEGGDRKAASRQAQAGSKLFAKNGCTLCHVPPLYSDTQFHNVGVGWDAAKKAFADHGRMDATKDAGDDGKFKTPSLREAAKTGPWFHDGHEASLDAAIDWMAAGGAKNPGRDEKLKAHKLSKADHAALKAFIQSLSGTPTFTTAPTLP